MVFLISIDCVELTANEKLALATWISTALEGKAVALAKGDDLVLDELTPEKVQPASVQRLVEEFVRRRSDPTGYSVEIDGEKVLVHSPDPAAAMKNKREDQLPPNLLKCPFCGFITPAEEMYVVHVRSHYFMV